jgi:hypothetical protein
MSIQERTYEVAKFGIALNTETDATGTTYGNMIDTLGYDGLTVVLIPGSVPGDSTASFSLVQSAGTNASAATAITGATFSAPVSNTAQVGFYKCDVNNRYVWVKSVVTTDTLPVAAVYALGQGHNTPEMVQADASWGGLTETKPVLAFCADDQVALS